MSGNKNNRRWLKEHFSDIYVKRAQQESLRSRAFYKLLELQEKNHLFKPGMTVIDLGAAPGSWSQLLVQFIHPTSLKQNLTKTKVFSENKKDTGKIIALDILPMQPLNTVKFIQGDFSNAATLQKLFDYLQGSLVDVIVSDMSPNLSGIAEVDTARTLHLLTLVLDFSKQVLRSNSHLLMKAFQGEGIDLFLKELKCCFQQVSIRKPKASRSRSAEIYLLAKNYRSH